MEFYKYNAPDTVDGPDWSSHIDGELINGVSTITWTERYRDPGEFKIVTDASSGLDQILPIGTMISHTNTYEIMFVENHLITETKDETSKLEISGRSYEAFLENRIVGGKDTFTMADYTAGFINLVTIPANANGILAQALELVQEEITTSFADRNIPNIEVIADNTGYTPGSAPEIQIRKGDLHKALLGLLEVDNLGIEVIKQNPFGVKGLSNKTVFRLYLGQNRSSSVLFSVLSKDFDSIETLKTSKKHKNTACVVSRYFEIAVPDAGNNYSGIHRREILIDASDLDSHYDTLPTGGTKTVIIDRMAERGRSELARMNSFTLSRADTSEFTNAKYREDYFLGDLVTIEDGFSNKTVMRVTEFTEIVDVNGATAHPTFGVVL